MQCTIDLLHSFWNLSLVMGYGSLPDCANGDCWARDNPERADEVHEVTVVLNDETYDKMGLNTDRSPCHVTLCNVCFDNMDMCEECTVCNYTCIDPCHEVNGEVVCEMCIQEMVNDPDIKCSHQFKDYLLKTSLSKRRTETEEGRDISDLYLLVQQYRDLCAERKKEEKVRVEANRVAAKRRFVELGIGDATASKLVCKLHNCETFKTIDDVIEACLDIQ